MKKLIMSLIFIVVIVLLNKHYSKEITLLKEVNQDLRNEISLQASIIDNYRVDKINLNNEITILNSKKNSLKETIVDLENTIEEIKEISKGYKVGEFRITAYSPYDNVSGIENDGNPNSTATGTKPRPGTIAVDPKVIPYGSNIIIIYEDGTIETGIAEDCGGAIKGNIIDVFRYTYKETVRHGIKKGIVIYY